MALDPVDVIRRFEPILYFHRDERFFPSDAKRYMERCALWDVIGGPRDDKSRWGGTSPRTLPHRPRIPRGKLVARQGEAPVVPQSADGRPGQFIGQEGLAGAILLDNADGERFLDPSGWIGGDAVSRSSQNRYAALDEIAALYDGGDAALTASRFWYHAEVFSAARLERLLRLRNSPGDGRSINDKRFAALEDPALVCYYLFFPGHIEPLEDCPHEEAARWASCAGEWACIAVLLRGDGTQNDYQPSMIGLTSRNAGVLDFLGQEPRVGMRVSNWDLVSKVVRQRPGAPDGEHPRVFVTPGTHALFPDQAERPAARFSPDDFSSENCGRYESQAAFAAANRARVEEDEDNDDVILAKFIAGAAAGAALGAKHGSLGGPAGALAGALSGAVAGSIAGFIATMAEARSFLLPSVPPPAPPQTDRPPGNGEIGTVIHPRGIDPPDAPAEGRREWPRLDPGDPNDEREMTTTISGRSYSLWVAGPDAPDSRPVWLPSDDAETPSFRGRWGNRVQNDPFNRRSGMRFPEFWLMFVASLGKY